MENGGFSSRDCCMVCTICCREIPVMMRTHEIMIDMSDVTAGPHNHTELNQDSRNTVCRSIISTYCVCIIVYYCTVY